MHDKFAELEAIFKEIKALLEKVKDPQEDDWDPIRLGLLLSKLEYSDIDVEKQLAYFAELVERVRGNMPVQGNMRDQTEYVARVFAGELEFSGDRANYYNPKNSFLNDVLVRRKGIPVTLSLIFMGLCRGMGLKALGVNFPGHFLVKMCPTKGHFDVSSSREQAGDWTKQWYVDCFDSGKILTTEDCERRLFEWTRGVVPFGPETLSVSHPVEIVGRLLRNLKAIFSEKEDYPRMYWVLSSLIELSPRDCSESYRERGLLMARMGRYRMATSDLVKYLEKPSDLSKVDHIQRLIRYFESQSELVN